MIKILRIQLIVLINLLAFAAIAQITHGGTPYSFQKDLNLPEIHAIDNAELYWIDSSNTKDCSAMEFARFLDYQSKLGDQLWSIVELENGDHIYRLGITSPGALAIGLYFKNFYLPKGAELFVYSPISEEYHGSYTSSNNTEKGFFSPEMVLGDEIVLEYYEPKSVIGKGKMDLFQVLHAYRAPFSINGKDFGDSGDCEVNVKCPEGYGKENQRDAVLRLLIKSGNSGIWCTGSLINNTRQDKIPYVLTADHCGKYSTDEEMLLWRFYFNYQSNDCNIPEEEPQLKSMLGCKMRAASNNTGELGSDFFLVELTNEIPPTYNPYFIGWNRDGLGSDFGFTIHHPSGDIKKISTYSEPLTSASYSTGITLGYWRVSWIETQSGHGVTEGGSSGSPIFDEEGHLIGTLTGGQASCSALTSPDFYGKFSLHWEENGDNSDEQLAPWLDPDNTGQMKLGGVYLDIEEVQSDRNSGFTFAPNPARDYIELQLKDQFKNVQVDLIHINGQVLHSYYFNESSTINISALPKGVYLVRLINKSGIYVEKLVKE